MLRCSALTCALAVLSLWSSGCGSSQIDPCGAAPCEHGSCLGSAGKFVCVCAEGYTGATCGTNLDDCAPNPCFNGGTCTDGVDTFTCACPTGFSGTQCEKNVDDCSGSPCANGGVCLDGVNQYTCVCAVGFAGATCATNLDDCAPNPCFNGGTCTDGVNAFTCACPLGFSGTQCEKNADDCSGSPCANGGACIDGVNRYTCVCAAGYGGATCGTNVDDCAPNPCFNGGACTDGVNTFTCACPAGFWGAHCELAQIQLSISTTSPLSTAVVGIAWSAPLVRAGGSTTAVWTLEAGGTNSAWLTLDAATGVLQGTPSAAQLGAVSVTVRVQDPLIAANFAEKTFTLTVIPSPPSPYDTSFETGCPGGWTLTGDWQCGAPSNVGPSTAFAGTACLGTQLASTYSSNQTWAGATATSPAIVLPAAPNYLLNFRLWVDTEGSTYDGVNLSVSTDSGATWSVLTTVLPAYPLVIAGQPAWGGHQALLGWQLMQADLSAFAGMTVRVRFAFQSDSSGTFAGAYVDDLHTVVK